MGHFLDLLSQVALIDQSGRGCLVSLDPAIGQVSEFLVKIVALLLAPLLLKLER